MTPMDGNDLPDRKWGVRPAAEETLSRNVASEAGYTLVETSLAIALGAIVLGLVVSAYLFGIDAITRWERSLQIENAAHLAGRRLAADVRAAARAEIREDRLLLHQPEETVLYQWGGDTLRRNGALLHPESYRCLGVTVEMEANPLEEPSVEGTVAPPGAPGPLLRIAYTLVDATLVEATPADAPPVDSALVGSTPVGSTPVDPRRVDTGRPGRTHPVRIAARPRWPEAAAWAPPGEPSPPGAHR
jgi:hypothetical protein